MVTSPQAKRAEAWATGMSWAEEVMTNQTETQVVLRMLYTWPEDSKNKNKKNLTLICEFICMKSFNKEL